MASTYVLGLGNVLMGDDGFGPAVVRQIEAEFEIEGDVELVDLGTPGLDLTPWLADTERVILIDTVKAELPPGSCRVYGLGDVLRYAPVARVSPHDPGVKETLLALEFAGRAPGDLTLFGVVPSRSGLGLDLSAPVKAAVPATVQAVVDALRSIRGVAVSPRVEPRPSSSVWTALAGL